MSSELDALKDQLSVVVADSESAALSLDEAHLQVKLRSNRIQELERQLSFKDGDSESSDNADLIASRDHLQMLAAKFAITILQLKMKCKKYLEQRHQLTQLTAANQEKYIESERQLQETKTDRKTLAAKLLQEHENLIAAGNDNRVLFETMMIHEEEFVIASETKLESTLPSPLPWDTANSDVKSKEQEDSSQMIPEKKLEWMVTKLASTLMKRKAREINLSNEKSSLKKQVLDLQNVSDHAQNLSKAISKQKVELSGHLLFSRRDKLEKLTFDRSGC